MTTLEAALNRNSEIIALSIGLKCACTCDKNCGRLATVMDLYCTPLCDECSKVPPKSYSNGVMVERDAAKYGPWVCEDMPQAKRVRRLEALMKGER